MRCKILCGAMLGLGLCTSAFAQGVLDRVLDRVEKELDERIPPAQTSPTGPASADAAGEIEPGYLGVLADDRQEQGRGVRLTKVMEKGPAAQGGLAVGDVITAINGRNIRNVDEMQSILSSMAAGTKVTFNVTRVGVGISVAVTLGTRPNAAERAFPNFGRQPEEMPEPGTSAPASRPRLGVRTLAVSEESRRQNNLPNREGALVISVTPGTPAALANIPVGAVITKVGDQNVKNPDHLAELVTREAAKGELEITYVAGGEEVKQKIALVNKGTPVVATKPESPPVPDETRMEALERRLGQLEDRIQKLESMIEKQDDGNPLK